MRLNNIISSLALVAAVGLTMTSCEDEKDLVIIEGNLPIKTTTLYIVGDATPTGWSIDAPTPLTPTEEDPLVFHYDGKLNKGEFKLCLTTGSWDAGFIRPVEHGTKVNSTNITNAPFIMHAGDPDEKWYVEEAGNYLLTFDLRNWVMSTEYKGESDPVQIIPIETETFYIIGDATPNGWDKNNPTPLEKVSQYIFTYEGLLKTGEMKACATAGSWDVEFAHPKQEFVEINKEGVAAPEFEFYAGGADNKWKVTEAAIYKVTFDLEHWTIAVQYMAEAPDIDPLLDAKEVYMIGTATPGEWDWGACLVASPTGNAHEFSWTGELATGSIKATVTKEYNDPFIRPASPDVEIGENGVATPEFVFTTEPDDQWKVTVSGVYTLTFNLEAHTISAVYKGEGGGEEPTGDPLLDATEAYMVGDATTGEWEWGKCQVFTATGTAHELSWTGNLKGGTFKAALEKSYNPGTLFIRPSSPNVEVNKSGVAASDFVYTADPDDQWKVTEDGNYTITLNLEAHTIAVKYNGEAVAPGDPLMEAKTVYMIGSATPWDWSWDSCVGINADSANPHVFTWKGKLKKGELKAALEKRFADDVPFIRPSSANVEINKSGVAASDFVFTAGDPDDKWAVTEEGEYTVTFDLEKHTITVTQ